MSFVLKETFAIGKNILYHEGATLNIHTEKQDQKHHKALDEDV